MDVYDQLKRDEGFKDHIYVDTTGNTTIGYGWNLSQGIKPDAAEAVMKMQADEWKAVLVSRLPWFEALDEVRQAVLVNMCFNMGFGALEQFTKFLAAAAQGQWSNASAEMLDSTWAKQVGERATRLASQMQTGNWT